MPIYFGICDGSSLWGTKATIFRIIPFRLSVLQTSYPTSEPNLSVSQTTNQTTSQTFKEIERKIEGEKEDAHVQKSSWNDLVSISCHWDGKQHEFGREMTYRQGKHQKNSRIVHDTSTAGGQKEKEKEVVIDAATTGE